MTLSAIHWVRMLVGGSLLLVWLPVITRPRGPWWPSVVISAVLILVLAVYHRRARTNALALVRDYAFPAFLKQKLLRAHPQLSDSAAREVERGLRQFFDASARAQGRFVAMPSRVVDTLWHEFILHTRGYEAFCRQAFGRMLHHTPAEALPAASNTRATTQREGLRRAWYWACRSEGIDPRKPSRLPLLFSLDATLGIAGGYVYALDCGLLGPDRGTTHCAGDLSSGCGGSSGDSGCAGDAGSGGSSSGDGGGDGGGGCGGGGD